MIPEELEDEIDYLAAMGGVADNTSAFPRGEFVERLARALQDLKDVVKGLEP